MRSKERGKSIEQETSCNENELELMRSDDTDKEAGKCVRGKVRNQGEEASTGAPLYQPRKSSNYISPQGGERLDYQE